MANNPCGSSTQILAVTVHPVPSQPGPITGNDTVCENSSQTYFIDTVAGATSYSWYLPYDWIGSITTNSISATIGAECGTIYITANNDYCSSDFQSFDVIVNPVPLQPDYIIGKNQVCKNDSQIYYTSPIQGATSYTWTLPSGWAGISNSSIISTFVGDSSGLISVTANNSCGGSDPQTLVIVSPVSAPPQPGTISGNIIANIGQAATYSINQVIGATNYIWSLSGGGTITSGLNTDSIIVNWQTPGNYVLSVKASNSCGTSIDQTLAITVSVTTGVINPGNSFEIKLLPNPSAGEFYLKAKGVQNKLIRVDITNTIGQSIYRSGSMIGANDYTQLINLDKMPQGIYVVKIMVDDKVYVRSVVINN